MPKWWASLRRVLFPEGGDHLDPDAMRALVERVTTADTDGAAREAADRAIVFLQTQCKLLKRLANNYPANGIRADVWVHGTALARWSGRLADDLERRGATELEEHARTLALSATCKVMGHYPEQVFPRVIRRAGCNERLGRIATAVQGYRAIVKDFKQLGLEADLISPDDTDEALDGAGRVTLEAVEEALRRLTELSPDEVPPGLLTRLAERLRD
jgi:hypothetical protein